ncbi:acyl-CoA dehydrogenase [Pseudoroseomonas wenyumeiae]|uniref:Acyl-CoA dehydrogenase n=1 Tax=Teichococcus wenyumeiae TaxID=2478470 RepID=A0A3A9J7C1_9PROT|nr:acyl-CoA dehydrogenase family protein [Pseudoroseomonas wenyumeiae]RKK01840.1 acyl-CoA dehydrogenase [Pseudoroseomonas wenyumeiae]RMI15179.1 acyl-CoA dehydrogenase [Pseudoroseomonas wenyumeiae]
MTDPFPPLIRTSLIQAAGDVAHRIAAPLAESVDRDGHWPREAMQALGVNGLLGLHVPKRLGGLGEGLSALAQVTEVLGKACGSTAMCFGMHCVATAVIAAKATPLQEERYLRSIAEGRHVTSLALSEPGTGAHFYLPRATFRREADGFQIRGSKSFVTSGDHADSYVVSTVAPGAELDPGTFTCLLIDRHTPGIEWGPVWNGIGMRGNSSRAATLNGVQVPEGNLLGREGDQIWFVFEVVAPFFLVAMSGTYLGIAQAALDLAVSHLQQHRHEHTSERLAENAALGEKVAEMWIQVERTRRLLQHAARAGDEGTPDAAQALFAAKIDVADTVVAVTNTAMTLLGGRGYQENGKLARLMRDAQAAHVMSPTTHLLKGWLSRSVLGLPLL